MRSLNIIGAGQVGRVLGRLFAQAGVFRIDQVLSRKALNAQQAVAFIGAGTAVSGLHELHAVDVTMLTVPDDQIEATCEKLVVYGLLAPGSVVFHCSGAKASTQLQAASAKGVWVASVHPVRSFADTVEVAGSFEHTICSIEGDKVALDVLIPALQGIRARVVPIVAEHKLLYHAGSVFASNYLVTLIETALQTYQAAGIPGDVALAMAEPLARQSLENAFRLGTVAALSGPIARGDLATVTQQQKIVGDWNSQVGALYAAFTPPTIELAARKKNTHSEK